MVPGSCCAARGPCSSKTFAGKAWAGKWWPTARPALQVNHKHLVRFHNTFGSQDFKERVWEPDLNIEFTFSQHLLYPELASLALSTPLLDTVSSLLGPNLVLLLHNWTKFKSNINLVQLLLSRHTRSPILMQVLLATTLFAKYPSTTELGER